MTPVLLLLAQLALCAPEAARYAATANVRAEAFDLAGASAALFTSGGMGCREAEAAAHFLRGLVAAREAYRQGGSPESLAPVTQAVAALEARGAKAPGMPEVWRYVLLAAAAAAQSERDQMAVLLEHAVALEVIQLEAGERGVTGATAHEMAGDLLLQVHRYDEARQAYTAAARRLGVTPRIRLGYARTAVRLKEIRGACLEYGALIDWWGRRETTPPEIAEARDFVRQRACQGPASRR